MSRRAKRRAVYVDDVTIVREVPHVRAVLREYGVQEADLDDMIQEVLLAAWQSMRAGRFLVNPATPLPEAIRRWLRGIARRLASHYHGRASRRYEVPAGLPWDIVLTPGRHPEEQLLARAILQAFRRLPPELADVLALNMLGAEGPEIASTLGICKNTASDRLRRARGRFRRLLTRWRRP